MKLIMENWRNYIAETEMENPYDCLYIFEGDSINKASFSERLKGLNESSEDDFTIFLEDWEKSTNHQFDMIEAFDHTRGLPRLNPAREGAAPPPHRQQAGRQGRERRCMRRRRRTRAAT